MGNYLKLAWDNKPFKISQELNLDCVVVIAVGVVIIVVTAVDVVVRVVATVHV